MPQAILGLVAVGILVAGICGYVLNIIALFHAQLVLSGEIILRIVGLVIPFIGAVMGYV
jgi:hypothetical protein